MWSCTPGGLREIVLSFKFRQNRVNRLRAVGVEISHFLYLRPVAYITACTTVQAVISQSVKSNATRDKKNYVRTEITNTGNKPKFVSTLKSQI